MRRTLAALVLAMTPPLAVLPAPSAQAQQVVVVRSGETLSEIAERHNVSLSRLMQSNGISDADLVVVGQRLTIPGSGATAPRNTQGTAPYTVKSGETLSEIADRFNTTTTRLIQINAISDPNLVMSGTRLQVPMPAQRSTPAPAAAPAVNRNASEHVVQPGESLSLIAERYGTSVSRLVALNQLGDPELVMVGSRLKLRGTPPAPRTTPQPAAQPKPAAAKPAVAPTPQPVAAAAPVASPQPAATIQPATTQQAPTVQAATVQGPTVQPAPIATASPTAAARTATATTAATATATTAATATATTAATATAAATTTAASAAARSTPAQAAVGAPASAATAARSSVPARPTAAATTAAATTTAARTAAAPTTAVVRPAGEWRNYGPLQVDWSKIQPMGGSYVAPSLNSEGQALYVAVNCTARKINVTSQAGQWRVWENPSKDFEYKLVQDICQARST